MEFSIALLRTQQKYSYNVANVYIRMTTIEKRQGIQKVEIKRKCTITILNAVGTNGRSKRT